MSASPPPPPPLAPTNPSRWEALDLLRGLTVIGMLLSLCPGAWEHQYKPLIHVPWEGWNLVDMVAPTFLFCIGAALPWSFQRRWAKNQSLQPLLLHVGVRSAVLVALGIFLQAYPTFDWATARIPGVLQRIGAASGLTSVLLLLTARPNGQKLEFSRRVILGSGLGILVAYSCLLFFVPVPGYGAPRLDPVGSWPSYVDRLVFGVPHLFIHWPVDGKVVFDPDGLLSTLPVCSTVLIGFFIGLTFRDQSWRRPLPLSFALGAGLMLTALALHGVYPIIKNLWTATFVFFSSGFSLVVLGALHFLKFNKRTATVKAFILGYGENPLMAYVILWLLNPVLDLSWIPAGDQTVSLRSGSQLLLQSFLEPKLASLIFAIACVLALFLLLRFCQKRGWILKL